LKYNRKAEETALGLAALLLLEALGLEFAHTETLGAVIAIFAAAFVAVVLRWIVRDPE